MTYSTVSDSIGGSVCEERLGLRRLYVLWCLLPGLCKKYQLALASSSSSLRPTTTHWDACRPYSRRQTGSLRRVLTASGRDVDGMRRPPNVVGEPCQSKASGDLSARCRSSSPASLNIIHRHPSSSSSSTYLARHPGPFCCSQQRYRSVATPQ